MSEENPINKKMKFENILNKFKLEKVLNENNQNKLVFVKACEIQPEADKEPQNAVIIFEKPHFNKQEIENLIELNLNTKTHISNDIYTKLSIYPTEPLNNVEVQLIYPATNSHIQKYTAQETFVVRESYDDYLKLTLPSLESYLLNVKWVHNILEHKSEVERIIFEDTDAKNGFILLPDMKWDGKTKENLYLLTLVHQRDIKSLRDLTVEHLPLLENIYKKSLKAIKDTYGLDACKIRAFIHYQPTFYHLHVHFTHIKYVNCGIECDRSHLLTTVIENLRVCPDYYQNVELTFMVRKNDKLYNLYEPQISS